MDLKRKSESNESTDLVISKKHKTNLGTIGKMTESSEAYLKLREQLGLKSGMKYSSPLKYNGIHIVTELDQDSYHIIQMVRRLSNELVQLHLKYFNHTVEQIVGRGHRFKSTDESFECGIVKYDYGNICDKTPDCDSFNDDNDDDKDDDNDAAPELDHNINYMAL